MPTDKIKNPAHFPGLFSYPLKAGPGKYFLHFGYNRNECKNKARQFRCYLRSLQAHPLHPLNAARKEFSIRTGIEQVREDLFYLYINVKKKVELPGF